MLLACFSGKLMFLMKWLGTNEAEYVPARQANLFCPQIIIKYYEQRIKWYSRKRNDEEEFDEEEQEQEEEDDTNILLSKTRTIEIKHKQTYVIYY